MKYHIFKNSKNSKSKNSNEYEYVQVKSLFFFFLANWTNFKLGKIDSMKFNLGLCILLIHNQTSTEHILNECMYNAW